MRLPGRCSWWATDVSHRVAVGMGGVSRDGARTAHRLANVLHACRACHAWVHRNPSAAAERGLALAHGPDPATVAVLRRGVRVLLGDDGSIRYPPDAV